MSLEEQFNKDCWKIYQKTVVETKYRPEYLIGKQSILYNIYKLK
jgi:hypothetical protein